MADERVVIEIELDDGTVKRSFSRIEKQANASGAKIGQGLFGGLSSSVRSFAATFGAALSGAAVIQAIRTSINAFAEFEKGLVAVGKTSELTGRDLEKFGDVIEDLTKRLPVSSNELLEFAEAAGQLGVRGEENLAKFSETAARLSVATDLAGKDGVKALTRILNVTKESVGTIDRLGSVVTALGNNFAASESEIVSVTKEVAKSTAVFGASSAQAAGIATALKALGVEAEAGGTAVGRVFREINKALSTGGAQLKLFTEILGLTAKELRTKFKEDAVGTFELFIKRLNQLKNSGADIPKLLRGVSLDTDRLVKSLLPLIGNYEELSRALDTANKESKDSRALNEESAKAFATLASDIQLTINAFQRAARALGESLSPVFKDFLSLIRTSANEWGFLLKQFNATRQLTTPEEIKKLDRQIFDLTDKIKGLREEASRTPESPSGILTGFSSEQLLNQTRGFEDALTESQAAQLRALIAERDILFKRRKIFEEFQASESPTREDEKPKEPTTVTPDLGPDLGGDAVISFTDSIKAAADEFSKFGFTVTNVGKQIRDTVVNGISGGFSKAFSNIGANLARGEDAFKNFGGAIVGAFGQIAVQLGQFYIKLGIAQLFVPGGGGSGAGLIAAGIGLSILGGVLSGLAGAGGAGGASAAAQGVGGGGFETTDDITGIEEEDLRERTSVAVNIEGNVLDRQETGLAIAEILREQFDSEAITVTA